MFPRFPTLSRYQLQLFFYASCVEFAPIPSLKSADSGSAWRRLIGILSRDSDNYMISSTIPVATPRLVILFVHPQYQGSIQTLCHLPVLFMSRSFPGNFKPPVILCHSELGNASRPYQVSILPPSQRCISFR